MRSHNSLNMYQWANTIGGKYSPNKFRRVLQKETSKLDCPRLEESCIVGFNLFGSDGRRYVNRPVNARYHPRYQITIVCNKVLK